MITHQFCHVPIVLVAIDKERISVKNLTESFGTSKFLIGEVRIDSVTGNVFRPLPLLLYQGLTIDAVIVHGNDSDQNAEPTVHLDNLSHVVYGLLHIKHKGGCLRLAWKLVGECPTPIRILWAIFPLLQFHPKNDRLPL